MLKPDKFNDTQDVDCCGDAGMMINEIAVEIYDGGGGNYLTITTSRWALSDDKDIDDFCKQLKKCLKEADNG